MRPRVLLADDHIFFLEALKALLQPDYQIVDTASDGQALLEKALRLEPEVVVLDISMPNLDGLAAARRLKEALPGVKLIFLTQHDEPTFVSEALEAGASGYLLKSSDPAELHKAMPMVLAGHRYITPLASDVLVDPPSAEAADPPTQHSLPRRRSWAGGRLTERQCEVLRQLTKGESMKRTAAALKVSPSTIAFHKYRIMDVLGVKSSTRLIRWALENGITAP